MWSLPPSRRQVLGVHSGCRYHPCCVSHMSLALISAMLGNSSAELDPCPVKGGDANSQWQSDICKDMLMQHDPICTAILFPVFGMII